MAFVDAHRDDIVEGRRLGVELICRVLQVAPSSYYAAKARPLSARERRDAQAPWCRVEYKGMQGWVSARYVKEQGEKR